LLWGFNTPINPIERSALAATSRQSVPDLARPP